MQLWAKKMMDSPEVISCKVRFDIRILIMYVSAGKVPRHVRLSFTTNAAKAEATTGF